MLDKLAADGFDPVYGARPLRHEVERQLENPLVMKIVTGECPEASRVLVQIRDGAIALSVEAREPTPGGAPDGDIHAENGL